MDTHKALIILKQLEQELLAKDELDPSREALEQALNSDLTLTTLVQSALERAAKQLDMDNANGFSVSLVVVNNCSAEMNNA